ncbi:glycosyl transferase family 2 [Paraphotobacterium marinum]|uniref:Glycosyl transferase family 2 n=1 Tax=Paraphotobacterium marinum TaxID=1755811 RepID=A0A220VFJ6_9GAMM|nr:glycosyltransferase family 2 protein [Paraphotobacterium marinum]ASK79188.1 glycosyl transferase family 2 [Paraphotobacterium marinum]
MTKISFYVLTFNSEMYIESILNKIQHIADEILIIDSGSTDKTKEIVSTFANTAFIFNKFEDFKQQRIFAEKSCKFDMILFLDSDEEPNDELINSIKHLKSTGFVYDAYRIKRLWNVLKKDVHSIYPICSPDYPIRLYNRKSCNFNDSPLCHEQVSGYSSEGIISGHIKHITFENFKTLKRKLKLYTNLAANDLILKNKKPSNLKIVFNPIGAFIKWYVFKSGFKDGIVGVQLGVYAYLYTLKKYNKAQKFLNQH